MASSTKKRTKQKSSTKTVNGRSGPSGVSTWRSYNQKRMRDSLQRKATRLGLKVVTASVKDASTQTDCTYVSREVQCSTGLRVPLSW